MKLKWDAYENETFKIDCLSFSLGRCPAVGAEPLDQR